MPFLFQGLVGGTKKSLHPAPRSFQQSSFDIQLNAGIPLNAVPPGMIRIINISENCHEYENISIFRGLTNGIHKAVDNDIDNIVDNTFKYLIVTAMQHIAQYLINKYIIISNRYTILR
jgi:hypothetical protein